MNSKEKKYAIIIGAMKSGTTSLYQYMRGHPKICPCNKKEPEFFSSNQRHGAKVDRYECLWKFDSEQYEYNLEASTGYTKYPFENDVPEKIRNYGVNPKFIYIVRNPVRRIESQYNFMNKKLGIKVDSFEDRRLVELSKYFQQLDRFRSVFPERDRYLVLDFEELKTDTSALFERCADFLGLDPQGFPTQTRAHGKTPTRAFDLWLDSIGEMKNRIGRLLSERHRRKIKGFLRTFTPEVDHLEMSPSEREAVREELRSDIEKFGDEYGFDISKWGF